MKFETVETDISIVTTEVVDAEIIPNLFHDATTNAELLGMLAGYTSVCWVDRVVEEGKYGRPDKVERVFDSERASNAVNEALVRLEELAREQ